MACRRDPPHPVDPYPDGWERIGDLSYDTDLVLLRRRDAVAERRGHEDAYILARPYAVTVQVDGAPVAIEVPAGLVTDLTSVPPLFRVLVSRAGPWLEAAIVHDYLYVAWRSVPGRGAREADRAFADRVMLSGMRAARVDPLRRWAIFAALRLFGGRGYRRVPDCPYDDLDGVRMAPPRGGYGLSIGTGS